MLTSIISYPFIFLAIFFESFVLVSLLSEPAYAARKRRPSAKTPLVAVIVPCYNEAQTISGTIESLRALDYPKDKLEVILVDDGSTDDTPSVMERFAQDPRIRIIHKKNGGKYTALNAGIATTDAEFIGCLDADSFVAPNALREILSSFEDPKVAATTAAMSIYQPKNILEHMQQAEYLFGITLRHALASVNGLYVTPGPFSFYRHSVLTELGGFRYGHQTEDMEMALRIQQAGYEIENAPRARVYTKGPKTLPKLIRQRTRWTSGSIRNTLGEYRGLIGDHAHPALGFIVLPLSLLAIVGSIALFALTLFGLVHRFTTSAVIHSGVPLSYAISSVHPAFDLSYLPINFFWLMGAVALLLSFGLIIFGKRISKAPGAIALGLVSYTVLYAFVVPLWLIRSAIDVTIGKHRAWR